MGSGPGAEILQGRAFETGSRLLPELADDVPGLPPPLMINEAEVRLRLFEAIARLGLALAESTSLVLFIDDLHWADAASLEVLQYLVRRWAEMRLPILLMFGLRNQERATQPNLRSWLSKLQNVSIPSRPFNCPIAAALTEIIRGLAARIDDESLRTTFLTTSILPTS